ncbi:hypothetical protein C7S20_08280 [Christiangramia fulva]|uniref:Lipid/polyisoprenoid-binding YceI-like domain-containing protein n=1 Tax=Christiangramia fulva TaxID=2126553 RepID=A0A2R3Z4V0_9FLAO|nr:YceI family protein [Christiangramia fulva]AVR45264.1 hypothetical protein C7S20_08280 [Christiangramia fulva]
MKTLLTSILSVIFCTCITAQKDFDKAIVKISPKSELVIAGSTNVNKFNCRFNTELIGAPKNLEFTTDGDNLYFKSLALHLETRGFDCGHRKMNDDLWDLLQAQKYPEIVISVNRIKIISESYAKAYITVQMAGQSNKYSLPVKIDGKTYSGRFEMNIRDFGLEPPVKALGLIEVNEMIEVNFNLQTLVDIL